MTDSTFSQLQDLPSTEQMPFLFVGHGNPMNAILDTEYGREWERVGQTLPRPTAILAISAHWLTPGSTRVLALDVPRTIHDFGGFPQELFDQQYPAQGSPEFAKKTIELIRKTEAIEDYRWGLDHGTWSVLKKMYPQADIPVYQLSIDYSQPPEYHYQLAKDLVELRNHGVLILGSGNIVHNLTAIGRNYDWAAEFDGIMEQHLSNHNHKGVVDFLKLGELARLAHPTHDHFLPLIYSIGLQTENDEISYFNDTFDFGTISMRSVLATAAG